MRFPLCVCMLCPPHRHSHTLWFVCAAVDGCAAEAEVEGEGECEAGAAATPHLLFDPKLLPLKPWRRCCFHPLGPDTPPVAASPGRCRFLGRSQGPVALTSPMPVLVPVPEPAGRRKRKASATGCCLAR